MRVRISLLSTTLVWLIATTSFSAGDPSTAKDGSPVEHRIPHTDAAPQIDGILDEPAWSNAAVLPLPYEVRLSDSGPAELETTLLLMHDDQKLYAAFRAHDPNPAQIRARLTDRDRAYDDDFVGLALDTFHDGRRGVEFFVNPLGVQMDLVVSDGPGGGEDDSWDAIWESAGRVHETGYVVEIAIPFASLRFHPGLDEKVWGVDAFRVYEREKSLQFGLVKRDRNRDCYLCQFDRLVGFRGASPGKALEITPTITTTTTREFEPATGRLGSTRRDSDPGLTVRWGVTPSATLQATLNPDFSQVEADALQLQVNQQFALFFPEKRPFFLEGQDYYATLFNTVYTRTIVDPSYGLKLNGKFGANVLGAFVAHDDHPNLLIPSSQGSRLTPLGREVDLAVLRYRRDIGSKGSMFGLLGSGRRGDDYRNAVVGADSLVRLGPTDSIVGQFLVSSTDDPLAVDQAQERGSTGSFRDRALRIHYEHNDAHWNGYASYQDIGRAFRADLGFMPQADWRRAVAGVGHTWRGDANSWFSRLHWGGDWDRTEQHDGTLIEQEWESWVDVNGPKQSALFLDVGTRVKQFAGREFDQNFLGLETSIRPVGRLRLGFEWALSDAIDFSAARPAKETRLAPSLGWTPGRHLSAELRHLYQTLELNEGWLFRANLSELRVVYQFTQRLFLRTIVQHSEVRTNLRLAASGTPARSRDLTGQLLLSYKLNSVSGLYVGYTGDYQQLDRNRLDPTGKTLFVKLGYAFAL